MMLKIAVLAPMPRAKAEMATAANPGALARRRMASLRSATMEGKVVLIFRSGTGCSVTRVCTEHAKPFKRCKLITKNDVQFQTPLMGVAYYSETESFYPVSGKDIWGSRSSPRVSASRGGSPRLLRRRRLIWIQVRMDLAHPEPEAGCDREKHREPDPVVGQAGFIRG